MNRIFLAIAAAAGLVAAVPAAGQVLLIDLSQTVPLAATMDNPCTAQPEAIVLQGTTELSQRVWLMPDGNLRMQIAETTALQGQDGTVLLGGSPVYKVSGGSSIDLEFIPDSVTMWWYKKVTNSAGTQDNFHSVLAVDFDPGTLHLSLSLAPACDDGSLQ